MECNLAGFGMQELFWLGITLGFIITVIGITFADHIRRLHKLKEYDAGTQIPERYPDGDFYYLIREDEWLKIPVIPRDPIEEGKENGK